MSTGVVASVYDEQNDLCGRKRHVRPAPQPVQQRQAVQYAQGIHARITVAPRRKVAISALQWGEGPEEGGRRPGECRFLKADRKSVV